MRNRVSKRRVVQQVAYCPNCDATEYVESSLEGTMWLRRHDCEPVPLELVDLNRAIRAALKARFGK